MDENILSIVALVVVTLSFVNALYWKSKFERLLDKTGILENKYVGMKQGFYWREALQGRYTHIDKKLKNIAQYEILSIIAWISISLLYVIWGMSK